MTQAAAISEPIGWTDERAALALKWWREGVSATHIAKRLGGVSRSAVLGKVNRSKQDLGRQAPSLSLVHTPVVVPPRHAKPPGRAPRQIVDPKAWEPLPGSSPRHWTTRQIGDCAWPIGEFMSCCDGVEKGQHYCTPHMDIRGQKMPLDEDKLAGWIAKNGG